MVHIISNEQIDSMILQVSEFIEVAKNDDGCPNCGEGRLHIQIEANEHKVVYCRNCDLAYCTSCSRTTGPISLRDIAIRVIERSKNAKPDSFVSIWR